MDWREPDDVPTEQLNRIFVAQRHGIEVSILEAALCGISISAADAMNKLSASGSLKPPRLPQSELSSSSARRFAQSELIAVPGKNVNDRSHSLLEVQSWCDRV